MKKRKCKSVFCFESNGFLFKEFKDRKEASTKTKIHINTIDNAIKKKKICKQKFYFTYDKDFVIE